MQSYVDCIHCYLKQAANCMNLAGVGEERQYRVMFELMDDIRALLKIKCECVGKVAQSNLGDVVFFTRH